MEGREQFEDRLKRFREQRGLSQRELAKRARVPISTISYVESGKRVGISLGAARRIAHALSITVDRLVGDSAIGDDTGAEEEESLAARV